jgi:hypothetical protein
LHIFKWLDIKKIILSNEFPTITALFAVFCCVYGT